MTDSFLKFLIRGRIGDYYCSSSFSSEEELVTTTGFLKFLKFLKLVSQVLKFLKFLKLVFKSNPKPKEVCDGECKAEYTE